MHINIVKTFTIVVYNIYLHCIKYVNICIIKISNKGECWNVHFGMSRFDTYLCPLTPASGQCKAWQEAVMAQVFGSLPNTCEFWIEFLAPGSCLSQSWLSWALEERTNGW